MGAVTKPRCQFCGADINDYCGGQMKECADCYECRKRMGDFLQSPANRKFVYDLLSKHEPTGDIIE